jgi:hypothetical protein
VILVGWASRTLHAGLRRQAAVESVMTLGRCAYPAPAESNSSRQSTAVPLCQKAGKLPPVEALRGSLGENLKNKAQSDA